MARNDPRIKRDPQPAGTEPPVFPEPSHATRIPGRSPEWKLHSSLGQARSAVSNSRFGGRPVVGEEIWERTGRRSWKRLV